jgi:peptidoglycan/LPS O-acetylase OafA/YrhL
MKARVELDTAPVVVADGNGFDDAVRPPRLVSETSRAALSALPLRLHEGLAQSHLPALDGLRMVAALLVVLYHFDSRIEVGGHGVLSFFVLSGFLITWLLLKEDERYGTVSLRLFYMRRALRIFPAFYAFWLAWTAGLMILDRRIVWGEALSAFAYVSNYYHAILGDPNTGYSHTWSLAIEEQFYLLWPVSFLALRRYPRRLAVTLAMTIVGVWLYRLILEFGINVWQGYIYAAFDTRADHLLIGCLLAVVLRRGGLPRVWARLCTPMMSLVVLGLLATSILLFHVFGPVYRNVVGFVVDPLLVAILIPQVIALRDSIWWRWLNWRWVRYFGTISYSTYLYQQVVIDPVRKAFGAYPPVVQLVVTMAAIIVTASASYFLVERPFLRLKDRTAQRTEPSSHLMLSRTVPSSYLS